MKGNEKRLCYEGNIKEPDPENVKGFTRKERETLDENQTIIKKYCERRKVTAIHTIGISCYWLFYKERVTLVGYYF